MTTIVLFASAVGGIANAGEATRAPVTAAVVPATAGFSGAPLNVTVYVEDTAKPLPAAMLILSPLSPVVAERVMEGMTVNVVVAVLGVASVISIVYVPCGTVAGTINHVVKL